MLFKQLPGGLFVSCRCSRWLLDDVLWLDLSAGTTYIPAFISRVPVCWLWITCLLFDLDFFFYFNSQHRFVREEAPHMIAFITVRGISLGFVYFYNLSQI